MKIAFIGLGIMGIRMAKNAMKSGHEFIVYNRTKEVAEPLVTAGAIQAQSTAEAVADADIVITMLTTPEVVEELAFGKDGFVKSMKKSALWADCSTVNPSFSVRMHKMANDAGIEMIDAPVAGSSGPAETGQLVILVGGDAENLRKVQSLFDLMGKKTIHAGDAGKGSALKMLVNSIMAQAMLSFSENLLLGEKLGLDKDMMLDVLPELPVVAPIMKHKAAKMKNDDYSVEFPLEWMTKDIHLAGLSAYENEQPYHLAAIAKELFTGAKQNGMSREDFSAIYKHLKNMNE